MTLTVLVLAFVTLQRLGELFLARRNTARLLERGALEVAPGHYPLIVGLHTLWLGGLWVLALTRGLAPDLLLLAIFIVLQGLRVWVLATLGPRWTTRILVVPGERLIASGPYRYLSHPNYWVVIGEILVLPLAFGLVWYAAVFSILNLAVLWVRVRAENKALGR
jgi:methyltransferase